MRRRLTDNECIEIIQTTAHATLSMIDAQGKPYGIMINPFYVPHDNCVYFHSALKGRKIDAIKCNENVSLNFLSEAEVIGERYITRYRSVIAEGRAFIVEEESEKIRLLNLLCDRFTGVDPRRQEVIDKYLSAVCMIGIKLTTISGKYNDGN